MIPHFQRNAPRKRKLNETSKKSALRRSILGPNESNQILPSRPLRSTYGFDASDGPPLRVPLIRICDRHVVFTAPVHPDGYLLPSRESAPSFATSSSPPHRAQKPNENPNRSDEDSLANWASYQRTLFHSEKLSPWRIQMLEEIYFIF